MHCILGVWVCTVFWIHAQFVDNSYAESVTKKTTKAESSEPTFAGQYAFIGTLEIGLGDVTRPLCIVTALTENWVFTVYSCLSELVQPGEKLTMLVLDRASAKVKLPNFKLTANDIGESTLGINKVLTGDRFGEDSLVLMRLTASISTDLVSKVQLTNQKELDPKTTCVNVGWKPIYYPGTKAPKDNGELQDVAQKVSTAEPGDDTYISGTVLGQTIPTAKSNTTCKFENGSPLLCADDSKWNLVGVAGNLGDDVAGQECKSVAKHSVYISIEPFVQWIYSQIRKSKTPEE